MSRRILVVEDQEDNRRILRDMAGGQQLKVSAQLDSLLQR